MSLQDVLRRIDERAGDYVEECRRLLRQPSVSVDRGDVARCAELIKGVMKEAGAEAELVPVAGEGNPVVYGTLLNKKAKRTVAAYQMYDTQPINEPEKWASPPFEARIVDGKIVARGAINSKGALAAELCAVKAIMEVAGEVPVNVVFTFDGEEEVGSWQLRRFLKEHPGKLLKAESMWTPGVFSTARKETRVTLGGKGCIDLQLAVDYQRQPVHSSCAPVVENPAWRLVWALESLRGRDGRIMIEGFYDRVAGPQPGDMDLLRDLAARGEVEKMKRNWGVREFKGGLEGADLVAEYMFQPTLTINGLQSGYVGPAALTINPGSATANMDIRLVPDMDADEVWRSLEAQLVKNGFPDVKVRLNGWKANASRSRADTRIVEAHRRAMTALGFKAPSIYPMSGGTGPSMYYTAAPLSMDSASAGSDDLPPHYAHAPNEYIGVEEFVTTAKMCAAFLMKYGEL